MLTVILHSAAFSPSSVVAVMVHVPLPTAVTLPFSSTIATLGLLEVHVTFLFAASSGDTVTVSCAVSPAFVSETSALSSVTPLTSRLSLYAMA